MKKISTLSGTLALLTALGAAGTALWAQAAPEATPGNAPREQHLPQLPGGPFAHGPGIFLPPPPPLYEASLQTQQPDEALNKLVANAPKGNGKNYEVKVMVRELPPAPSRNESPDTKQP
ncbi:hypothetical protein FJU30_24150 [Affinibrenneria salicis]|uniref:Uncharacterized protein n=1 Tax=Affinibrenneria salicis TaxID=2590031 RepID=A0A5J5FQX4_9GAMM|nr:hypothetical protein [Affinibrenneria salicis]KAA8995482.1 hypothetical protein FJU30_24150 [Affinibrenneria salicis]